MYECNIFFNCWGTAGFLEGWSEIILRFIVKSISGEQQGAMSEAWRMGTPAFSHSTCNRNQKSTLDKEQRRLRDDSFSSRDCDTSVCALVSRGHTVDKQTSFHVPQPQITNTVVLFKPLKDTSITFSS